MTPRFLCGNPIGRKPLEIFFNIFIGNNLLQTRIWCSQAPTWTRHEYRDVYKNQPEEDTNPIIFIGTKLKVTPIPSGATTHNPCTTLLPICYEKVHCSILPSILNDFQNLHHPSTLKLIYHRFSYVIHINCSCPNYLCSILDIPTILFPLHFTLPIHMPRVSSDSITSTHTIYHRPLDWFFFYIF